MSEAVSDSESLNVAEMEEIKSEVIVVVVSVSVVTVVVMLHSSVKSESVPGTVQLNFAVKERLLE